MCEARVANRARLGQTPRRGERLDEQTRNQIVKQLDELRAQVGARLGADPQSHDVAGQVDQLRALVQKPVDSSSAHALASSLERRLLGWEAEHPQLTALAARVARALEDAGL